MRTHSNRFPAWAGGLLLILALAPLPAFARLALEGPLDATRDGVGPDRTTSEERRADRMVSDEHGSTDPRPSRRTGSDRETRRPDAPPKLVTLKGEIVDLACYLAHEGKGAEHAPCARACVLGGSPVGLLAEGRLFVLFAPHDSAAPFEEAKKLAGQRAEVTGTLHERNGLAGLAVTRVVGRL